MFHFMSQRFILSIALCECSIRFSVLAFDSIPSAGSYVLTARGVFKENTITRAMSLAGGSAPGPAPLDEAGKKEIRDALDTYLKPYLRG
jgi:hypothetical protein